MLVVVVVFFLLGVICLGVDVVSTIRFSRVWGVQLLQHLMISDTFNSLKQKMSSS